MMRVVVIRGFIDKYTREPHEIGEKLTMTKERFEEISRKGQFVVEISDESARQEEAPADAEPEKEEKTEPEKKSKRTGSADKKK